MREKILMELYGDGGAFRDLIHPETKEIIKFHYPKPEQGGGRGHLHHHRLKPDENGKYRFFDRDGNRVSQGSAASHIYNPEDVWWNVISYYDFHDGYLIKVEELGANIDLYLESAQLDEEGEDLVFSEHRTIKGILHLSDVEELQVNGDSVKKLPCAYNNWTIYDFEIKKNKVLFVLNKIFQTPTSPTIDHVQLEVVAKEVVWENIPDLKNPYRR